ncbi:MAG: ribonuclease III [Rhodospirillales bacterium]
MAVPDPLVPPSETHPLIAEIETILGHKFARPDLPREAMTHRSAASGKGSRGSNERLEFVGDRVLGLIMAEWLAERFPQEQEGELGRRLAHLVSQPVLAQIADDIGLSSVLSVSSGEAKAGVKQRATVLADALEAALGALYLDGGLDPARRFIHRGWERAIAEQADPPKDPKSALQEWAHKRLRAVPVYAVTKRSGPPHAPEFTVTVTAADRSGVGIAGSKQAAEQAAAAALLGSLTA